MRSALRRSSGPGHQRRLPLITHLIDIVLVSIFQYFDAPDRRARSFVYFIFSLFCGTLRWPVARHGRNAMLCSRLFVIMGVSMSARSAARNS